MGTRVSQLSRIFNNIIGITTKEHVVISTNSHRPYNNRYIMSVEIVLFCWPVAVHPLDIELFITVFFLLYLLNSIFFYTSASTNSYY